MRDKRIPNSSNAVERTEPTLSESFVVQVRGWESENEDEAHEFVKGVGIWACAFSCVQDLSRLKSIVIAWDYPEALATLDRGEDMKITARTENEYGEGGAMSVALNLGGKLWSSVVIWTPLVRRIMDYDDPEHKRAVQALAHELVHVEDRHFLDSTYPGGWRAARSRDARDAAMLSIVDPLQWEYSAQRRSAHYFPEGGLDHLNVLEKVLRDVDEQIAGARLKYRVHEDIDTFWDTVRKRLAFLFQAIGYSIGYADYIVSANDISPELVQKYQTSVDKISNLPQGWLINACRKAVQPIFQQQEWSDMSVYDGLEQVLEQLLNRYGIYSSVKDGRFHLDMPYNSIADPNRRACFELAGLERPLRTGRITSTYARLGDLLR